MKIYTNIHNKIGYRFAKKNIIRKDAWRLSVVLKMSFSVNSFQEKKFYMHKNTSICIRTLKKVYSSCES